MESYPRVIVGTDGSPDATAAVSLGGRVASSLGVPLAILVAYDGDSGRDREWAEGIATAAATLATAGGATDVSSKPAAGEPDDVLLGAAEENPEALLIVGSSGLTKATGRLFGSTSNKLAHHSLADVLYARDPLPAAWNFVGLATDGSDTSIKAVRRGLILAQALKAKPRLITAAKNEEAGAETLAQVADKIGELPAGVELQREVIPNSDADSALTGKAWKWELLVIGNRGMSGPARLLGSVANKVTHGAESNLLLVNTSRG